MTELLVVMELWTEMLESGDVDDAIYLEYHKAFDAVLEPVLLVSFISVTWLLPWHKSLAISLDVLDVLSCRQFQQKEAQ